MTHAAEKFIMDPATTTTRDKERISVSRNLVLLLVLIFVSCIVATGLLVYHFSSCSRHVPVEKLPEENIQAVRDEESVSKEVPLTPLPSSPFAETSEPAGITTEAVTVHTQTESKTEEILDVRLPRSVIPHSYKLKLMPFLIEGNFTFHGEVTILVNVTEDTSNITLHADELEILESSVNIYDNSPNFINIPVLDITLDPKLHFLIIELNGTLKESQQYYVNIKFKGVLNDLLQGFYRSSYKEGNETRYVTQLSDGSEYKSIIEKICNNSIFSPAFSALNEEFTFGDFLFVVTMSGQVRFKLCSLALVIKDLLVCAIYVSKLLLEE